MASQIPFQKTYTNPHDLVALLQSRGLVVSNPAKAERYLNYIGYYRLSAYMYPSDFPSIDLNAMGFPQAWIQEPLWQ